MRVNKKGVAFGLVAIVSIILAITLGFVVFKQVSMARDSAEITDWHVCKWSVVAREQEKGYKLGTEPTQPFDCRTRFVTIDYGSGNINNPTKRGSQVEYLVDTEEDLMGAVARETAGCWWQMSAGTGNPFGNFDDDLRCVICSEVTFTDELVSHFPSVGTQTNSLDSYLETNDFEYLSYVNENYKELLRVPAKARLEGEDVEAMPNLATVDGRGKIPYTILFGTTSNDGVGIVGGSAAVGVTTGQVLCAAGAIAAGIATGGVGGVAVMLACGVGGGLVGTGVGIVASAVGDQVEDRDYYPFWYIGKASEVSNANCDQLY